MVYHLMLLIVFCLSAFLLGSCQERPTDKDLYPLTGNLTWHYNTSFRAGRISGQHKLIITNQETEFEGEKVSSHRFHNGDIAYYVRNHNGILRLALYSASNGLVKDPNDHFLIKFPVKAGTQWKINSKPFFLEQSVRKINAGQASLSANLKINTLVMKYEISSTETSINVSAGKYSHCVLIKGSGTTTATGPEIGTTKIDVIQSDWYAPGVGLIKSERRETTELDWAKSSVYTMELDKIY